MVRTNVAARHDGPLAVQVLFVYNAIDDFVMTNLKTYSGRAIKTAEAEDIDFGDGAAKEEKEGDGDTAPPAELSNEEAEDLCAWLKESALTDRVSRGG